MEAVESLCFVLFCFVFWCGRTSVLGLQGESLSLRLITMRGSVLKADLACWAAEVSNGTVCWAFCWAISLPSARKLSISERLCRRNACTRYCAFDRQKNEARFFRSSRLFRNCASIAVCVTSQKQKCNTKSTYLLSRIYKHGRKSV